MNLLTQRDKDVLNTFRAHIGKEQLVLETNYPHVITRLLLLWGPEKQDLIEFWDYQRSLVVSDRPTRQGFSPDAMREITSIIALHTNNFGGDPRRVDVWHGR